MIAQPRREPDTLETMPRTDLFIKVEIEHGKDETPDRVAFEVCRAAMKIYGVRSAELSSTVTHPEE